MWDYLLAPLDADRAHLITNTQLWHARLMFIAWAVCAPLAVFVARFFKVLPGQDWPNRLDSQFWWRSHWIGQSLVLLLTVVASALVYFTTDSELSWHGRLGYAVLCLVLFQGLLGVLRGSKGGPTEVRSDGSLFGDHYSMTRRRRMFESVHKSVGYFTLVVSAITIVFGYWLVNAPRWMLLVTTLWWCFMILLSIVMQRRGMALDTYQAIWGPDHCHPGNQISSSGWGVTRHIARPPAGIAAAPPAGKTSVVQPTPVKENSE